MADPPMIGGDSNNYNEGFNRTGIHWADGCKVSCFNNHAPLLMPEGTFKGIYGGDDATSSGNGHYGVGLAIHEPASNTAAFAYWILFLFMSGMTILSLFIVP